MAHTKLNVDLGTSTATSKSYFFKSKKKLTVEASAPDCEKSPIFEPVKIEVKGLRDHVINEILSSEQSYCRELHVLNYVNFFFLLFEKI